MHFKRNGSINLSKMCEGRINVIKNLMNENKKKLSDVIYVILIKDFVALRFKPDAQLNMSRLAKEKGVLITSVREAVVQRLFSDSLLRRKKRGCLDAARTPYAILCIQGKRGCFCRRSFFTP